MLTLEEQEQHLERIKKTRLEAQWNLHRLVDCNIDEVDFFSYINHYRTTSKTYSKHLLNALTITYSKQRKVKTWSMARLYSAFQSPLYST